jgi:Asp-tRNA(Asn)/Glu-tRNA(Gln) amidotransferase C subunit
MKPEEEAKKIMDLFMKELSKVKSEEDFLIIRNKQTRTGKVKINKEFKERILENAPSKDDDFIIAEKKHW